MTGLPTLQVQLDDGTGTFPFDITSKCLLEPGFSFTRGRDDWQGGVEAASISLTLNNSDGRFTPGSTILASPTPIKVDQRIRIKETINGITFNRFTGYVKSWPVAWPATVPTFSTVKITVTDAQARAERRTLRSLGDEETLPDSPTARYLLSEPTGATSAADSSGNQAGALTVAGAGLGLTFGAATGLTTDDLTGVQFQGGVGGGAVGGNGQYLVGNSSFNIAAGAVECWFTYTADAFYVRPILMLNADLDPASATYLAMANNSLGVWKPGTGFVTLATLVDGSRHYVALTTAAGPTVQVYVDGALVLTDPGLSAAISVLAIGGGTGGLVSLRGTVSHVAVYSAGLSAARILAHYQAGATGFAGESGTARITRTAGYANLPVGTLDTSLTNVGFTDITGVADWAALQQVADAEGGVVFVDGSGNLIFHNRNRAPAKTAPDLTLTAAYVTPDVQPVTDDQQILNYLEATSETTDVTQVVQNAASITAHGKYPSQLTYLVQTDQEALDRANWLVANYAEPTTRYGTLTINLYGMTAALAQSVLSAIEVNCWLRITGAPSQTPGSTTIDVVVEGYTEELTADSWTLSCNVVARSLFTALILDSATFGVLDSNRLYF